jgi:hypothetical protein
MAKAHIETAEGVNIRLEGTPDEIAAVLKDIKEVKGKPGAARKGKAGKTGKVTVAGLADELRDEEFFKKPKTLSEIKTRLADLGHAYPTTALSGPMQTEVKKKRLRRFKEKGKYVYAQ